MTALASRLEKVPELLEERARRYRVPGASLAVLAGGETFEAATGVVNLGTGVEATPDAVFQIGSITKVFTTTLVMQLVDEGRVELDAPVRQYLPELAFADAEATRSVTLRHLLTHTSGIDGDFFQDTGRGDDCIERYVLACAALPQLHAPGALFSYCNAGFAIAGRVIEKLGGTTWDRALRERLLDPIGAETMGTLPEEALLHRAAAGHFPDRETGELRVTPVWSLVRSNGPAGATPFAAARDLLALARLHLGAGLGRDGKRVLSEASVRAMQEKQVEVPDAGLARAWGLGWMLFDWGGARVIGHDGGTLGQSSFLRVLPERGIAVALLTNGGNAQALYRRVYDAILSELAGVRLPPLPEPVDGIELDPARYEGTYQRLSQRARVEARDGELFSTVTPLRGMEALAREETAKLAPISESAFVLQPPESRMKLTATFLEPGPDGRFGYLHQGGRTAPRVD